MNINASTENLDGREDLKASVEGGGQTVGANRAGGKGIEVAGTANAAREGQTGGTGNVKLSLSSVAEQGRREFKMLDESTDRAEQKGQRARGVGIVRQRGWQKADVNMSMLGEGEEGEEGSGRGRGDAEEGEGEDAHRGSSRTEEERQGLRGADVSEGGGALGASRTERVERGPEVGSVRRLVAEIEEEVVWNLHEPLLRAEHSV